MKAEPKNTKDIPLKTTFKMLHCLNGYNLIDYIPGLYVNMKVLIFHKTAAYWELWEDW